MGTAEPLSYRRPATRPRGPRRRLAGVVLLAILLAIVSAGALARASGTPDVALQRTVGSVARLPGERFEPAWPGEGQAAIAVEGLGSLGHSGGQEPLPIASVAKVMTAYVVLQEHPLKEGAEGFRIRITEDDVEDLGERAGLNQSVVEVQAGEVLSERQALEALLLPSANNVAALLAIHEAGSIEAFVAEMNETAEELGMDHTRYTDPSGFEATTVSTAADQIKLARVAMDDRAFAEIVALPSAEIPVAGSVPNLNRLVGYDGYVGIKTGSDQAAGGCLLFARRIQVGGRTLTILGAVLDQRGDELVDAALDAADRLAGSVADAIGVRTVLPAGTRVLVASAADGSRVAGVTTKAVRSLGWPGMPVRMKLKPVPTGSSLEAHQRVATLLAGGAGGGSSPVVTREPLAEPSLSWRLLHPLS